jgi:hypothetical protein
LVGLLENMSDVKSVYQALERLTLPLGSRTQWESSGLVLEFPRPFASEFLPDVDYNSGFFFMPGSEQTAATWLEQYPKRGKSFFVGPSSSAAPGFKKYATWEVWAKNLKPTQSPYRLHWVKEVPDFQAYNSIHSQDRLLQMSPFDPFTQWYLAKEGKELVGKLRLTQAENNSLFLSPPFAVHESAYLPLLRAAELEALKGGKSRLLLLADAQLTAEKLRAEAYLNEISLDIFVPT